jgi:hypothetical protein
VTFVQESAELKAVKDVCGKCHGIGVFLNKPRSWDRWNDVFADMTRRGADGTNDQLALVTRYFLQNLTLVNVNTSAAEELGWVLEVSDDVVAKIMEQRQARRSRILLNSRRCPAWTRLNSNSAKPALVSKRPCSGVCLPFAGQQPETSSGADSGGVPSANSRVSLSLICPWLASSHRARIALWQSPRVGALVARHVVLAEKRRHY